MPDTLKRHKPKSPPLTQEQKQQIIDLANQGLDATSIGQHLGINGTRVNGVIQTALVRGKISVLETPAPSLSEMPDMSQTPPQVQTSTPAPAAAQAPAAAPVMHSVPLPAMVRDAGFAGGGRPVQVDSGGFTSTSSELRWTVERTQPPDGVLGTHFGPFTVDELGQIYGSGTYRVTKQEPGKAFGVEFMKKIADSYGPPKSPKSSSSAQPPSAFQRRPWDGHEPGAMQMPFHRPFFHRPERESGDNSNVAAEAIRQMGQAHRDMLQNQKETPDNKMANFLASQNDIMNRRWEEDRQREELRRKTEEDKWDRQRRDDRERWEREQQSARDAHDREMQRIKAENEARLKELQLQAEEREKREQERQKFLLDLEEKRLQLVRQEAENQQKRLESEISRTREEMNKVQERTSEELKESRETTQKALEQNQVELNERMEREREVLEREYKIREKGMDREHELNREILNMQKQHLESQTGDQLFNMIQTFVKEASKGLERVCELKKLEAMTPEAQAAAVARGTVDGNVLNGPLPEKPEAGQVSAPAPTDSSAQPASVPDTARGIEGRIRTYLEQPAGLTFFRDITKEWAEHIKEKNDPSVWANLYLEMLQNQRDSETRLFCNVLFAFMSVRSWAKMYAFMKPYLTPDVAAIFEDDRADVFYEGFRGMVKAQINEYWYQMTMSAKDKETAARTQVQQPPPTVEVPVESTDDGASQEVPNEPLVVPEETHESPPQAS